MENIDATERPKLGEEVVTAGIELNGGVRSPYPKGLVVGSVVDVQRDVNDVVQTAFLAPAADLDAFIQALRQTHRTAHAEAALARRLLLQS